MYVSKMYQEAARYRRLIPNIDKLTRELVDLADQEQALLSELEELQKDEDELKKSIEAEE